MERSVSAKRQTVCPSQMVDSAYINRFFSRLGLEVLGGYFAGYEKDNAGDDNHADDKLDDTHTTTSFFRKVANRLPFTTPQKF